MDVPEVFLYIPVAHATVAYESLLEALGFITERLHSESYVSPEAQALAWHNASRWALAWAALNGLEGSFEDTVRHARAFLAEHSAAYLAWEAKQTWADEPATLVAVFTEPPESAGPNVQDSR